MGANKRSVAEKVVESVSSGVVVGCCIFGLLAFGFCFLCSFFGKTWPDHTIYLLDDNLAYKIANLKPIGAFEFFALDGFGFVPIAFFCVALKLGRPAWARKAAVPAVVAGLVTGIWAHFCYMPVYGVGYLNDAHGWLFNCILLFLAVFTALAFVVYLRMSDRRLKRERC